MGIIVQFSVQKGHAIMTCDQVDKLLFPCVRYITHDVEPGPACCNGVRTIKGLAQNTLDKRQVCSCVKEAANRYSNLKDDAAQALVKKCGVEIDVPVSRHINCDV
ncbi:hypothetical protein ACH5RR_000440 [Cinchona calisaya]|uniref:Non-specific lipid-transfer protein n=1 Tax=Cinchona calisaya TaxID=153742 RepID=A0ABD3B0Q2_9GENT